MAFRGSAPRGVRSALTAALLLLCLDGAANAAARSITSAASIHASLRYDDATLSWHGSFRAVRPDGAVTARGRVVDRPRQRIGADWLIVRTLTTRAGTLRFRLSGPFKTPTARLHWLIVGGTDAYAALQGHGIDVERVRETTATAVMRGVPVGDRTVTWARVSE
jgi:hypothetical protein